MKLNKLTLAFLSVLSFSGATYADVTINGFGNVVGGITSSDDQVLGFNDTIDFSNDSLFALQVSSDISDKLSATAQIISRGEDDFDASFEWAYITYNVSPSVTFNAGRFRLPLFAYSSSLDVGYTYHWITAPSVVYDVPFNNLDGVKLGKTGYVSGWDYALDVAFGTFKGETLGADNNGDNTVLVSGQISNESLTLRAVYGRTTTTIDLTQSRDEVGLTLGLGFDSIEAAGFAELADSLRIEEDAGEFVGVSVMYDNYDFFIGGEYTEVSVDNNFSNDDEAFYITAGARFGKWTPSLTYENFESSGDVKYLDDINQLTGSGLPAETVAALSSVAIGSQLAQQSDYDIITAALRYDLDGGMALKFDVQRLSDNVDDTRDGTLARMAVNFVF
ncbi:topoisomerase IV [uncultured Alteromonas sp.]|uniref:topoisomerase IV n=1 Tax=uncultured Alteromonas sp. TaxID=179113 RepID=UPI0030CF2201|tara:strand:+ start:48179 stop:49348 length:1170 start_codon:yes stop_codon:yes gene_type:complete